MIIHLESNRCESTMSLYYVDQMGLALPDNAAYLTGMAEPRYKCSDCQVGFRFMSGLFQHAETKSCASDLNVGAFLNLRRYINEMVATRAFTEWDTPGRRRSEPDGFEMWKKTLV